MADRRDEGRKLLLKELHPELNDPNRKIVTLLPSATEIVCALGLRGDLVGRSHECDFPPGVEALPILTSAQIQSDAPSAEIDGEVKSLLERGLSLYRVDAEALKALAPGVVVTQTQCEVCAVSLNELEGALRDWTQGRPLLISLSAVSLAGLWDDIRRVGEACFVPERAEALVRKLRARMEAVRARAAGSTRRPRVAMLEWLDPLMGAGNWMPELVEMAGGVPLFGKAGEHSPWLSWEEFAASEPDLVLVLPCGFSLERVRAEMPVLTSRPEWPALAAVRRSQVYLLDGNQYFNRPGPRLAESLEILAEILHPEIFSFGYQDRAWMKL